MNACFTIQDKRGAIAKLGLGIYNKVWGEGRLPTSWKDAIIIPIIKPEMESASLTSYRPVALTSHVGGKIMERMITECVLFYIERGKRIVFLTRMNLGKDGEDNGFNHLFRDRN